MSQQLEQRLRNLEATLLVNPRDPWTHSRRGHMLLQLGRFDEASAAFAKVISLAPNMPEGPQGLGEVELALGSWDAAHAHLLQALALDQGHIPTLSRLIRVHEERNELELAEKHYAAALRAKPDDPDWIRRAALNLYSQRKLDAALPLLERAKVSFGNDDAVATALAICLVDAGRWQDARSHLEPLDKRLALLPDDVAAFAETLMKLSDWNAAELVWARLKSTPSHGTRARIGLGRCHEERGLHGEALEELVPIADVAGSDADSYWLLGRAYDGVENAAGSLRAAEQGILRFAMDSRLHWVAGQALIKLGRINDAVVSLERAVRYAPDEVGAWLLLVDAHVRLEQFPEASRALERVVTIAPNKTQFHLQRARFERMHGTLLKAKECYLQAFQCDSRSCPSALGLAQCASELGDTEEARHWVEKALSIDPSSIDAIRLSGLLHLRNGSASEALPRLKQASRQRSDDKELLVAIAECHRLMGDLVHEADALELAFAIEPESVVGKRLGRACCDLRRFERSAEVLTLVAKECPNDAEAQRELGLALERLGETTGARSALKRACDIDRSDPLAHLALGRVCLGLGDSASAVTYLEHAHRLGANLPEVDRWLGRAYSRSGLVHEAIQIYQQCVGADRNDMLATIELGQVLLESGQVVEASRYLERVVEQESRNGNAWLLLGSANAKSSNDRRAVECFRKATLLQPDSAQAFRGLADSAAALGEHEEVVRAVRQWLRLQPDQIDALACLANSLEALTHFAEALPIWQQATELEPLSHEHLRRMGLAYARLNRFGEASECLARVLPLSSFPVESWEVLATCQERLGNQSGLVLTLNKVCEIDTASGVRWRRLGFAELAIGHEPKALVALERAWDCGARDEECRSTIARLHRVNAERELLAEQPDRANLAIEHAVRYLPNDVSLRVAHANILVRLKRWDEACAALERAITLDAYRLDCHLQLAELLEGMKDFERAISVYAKARQLAPDNQFALSGYARNLWQSGRQREALESLQRVVELFPDRAESRLQLGSLMLLEKRAIEALPHLTYAAESLPLNPEAQYSLATCYASIGQDESSVPAYERALAQCPDESNWSRELASSLQRLGRYDDVARILQPLQSRANWTAADAANLGLALARTGQDERAVELLREAVAGATNDELCGVLLECLWRLQRHGEVVQCANAILREYPTNIRALELAARSTLADEGDEVTAVTFLERLLVIQPTSIDTRNEIVRIRAHRAARTVSESVDSAIAELQRALELRPDDVDLLLHLAEYYKRAGQVQLALDYAKRCLSIDETQLDAWLLRGELEASGGRFGDARNSFTRSVAIAPSSPAALIGLARSLESINEFEEATIHYRTLSNLEPTSIEWHERLLGLFSELSDSLGQVAEFSALSGLRNLSDSELRRFAFLQAEVGQHAGAVEALTRMLGGMPADRDGLLQLSVSLAAMDREVDSIPWLERLLRLEPKHSEATQRLGIALSNAGRHDQAVPILERAHSSYSSDSALLGALAQSHAACGNKREQLAYLEKLAVLHPNCAAHWARIGQLCVELGEASKAVEPWLRAIRIDSNAEARKQLFELLIELTDLHLSRGEVELAHHHLGTALEQAAENAQWLLDCARRYLRCGDQVQATTAAQQSAKVSNSLEANLLLGELWLLRHQPLDAVLSYERAAELRVDSAAALIGLGRAQLMAEALGDAESTLRRVVQLVPRESTVHELFVRLYEQSGRLQLAVASQRRVVELSNDVESRIRLSALLHRAGDDAGSVEPLEQAVACGDPTEELLGMLADGYSRLERWNDVLRVADRALNYSASPEAWHERRGIALSRLDRVSEAIRELEPISKLQPDDAKLAELLADLYARSGKAAVDATNPRLAVEALTRAMHHGDTRTSTRRQLADCLKSIGDLHAALALAESCVRDEPTTDHWLLLGGLELALGRYELAATAYESAASIDPSRASAMEGLGLSYERLGRVDTATQALQGAVVLLPTTTALEALVRLHAAQQDWEQVQSRLEQLSRLRTLSVEELGLLARAQQSRGQLEAAAATYEDALEQTPDDTGLLLALGRIRLDSNRPLEAIAILERVRRIDSTNVEIDEPLAIAYSRAENHEKAIEVAQRRISRRRTAAMLRLLATSHEKLGQFVEASAVRAEIAALANDSIEALFALGNAQSQAGNHEQAIETYHRVHELSQGEFASAELYTSLLEVATKRVATSAVEEALVLIDQGLAVSTEHPAQQFELAKLLVRLRFPDRALAALALAAPRIQGNPEPLNLAASICESMQNWSDACDWYRRANSMRVDDYTSLVGLARCHLAMRSSKHAIEPLLSALEQRPTESDLAQLLLQSLTSDVQKDEQRQYLESALRLRPDDSDLRLRLAALEIEAQRHARVIDLLERWESVGSIPLEGQLMLAQAYRAIGRESNCQRLCELILQSNPSHALASRLLGQSRAQQGDVQSAIAALESSVTVAATPEVVRQLHDLYRSEGARMETAGDLQGACNAYARIVTLVPNDFPARISLAQLQVRLDRQVQAIDTLRDSLVPSIEFMEGYLLLARLYVDSGRADLGVEALQVARRLAPLRVRVAAQLGIALSRKGSNEEALEVLLPLADDPEVGVIAREELATLQRRRGDKVAAAEHLEWLRRQTTLTVDQQRELALFYAATGRFADALEMLSSLFREDGSDFDVAYAYGRVAYGSKLIGEGLEALRIAARRRPDRADVAVTLGQALLEQGAAEEALPNLERALSLGHNQPEVHEMIAASALQQGQRLRWVQALRARAELLPRVAGVQADLAHALESSGSLGEARVAIRRALSLERNPIWYGTLARCCLALSDPAGQLEALDAVCQIEPRNAAAWSAYGLARMAAGHAHAAIDALENSLDLDANNAEARDAYVRVAIPYAQEYLRNQDVVAALKLYQRVSQYQEPTLELLRELATCHSLLGQSEPAVEILRQALSMAPGDESASLLLASLQLQQNRRVEAVAVYEASLQRHPTSVALAQALSREYLEMQQFELAARVLAPAFSPTEVSCDYCIAFMVALTNSGRTDEAIQIGRLGLEHFPNSAELLHRLGAMYATEGWHQQGAELLARAAQIEPPVASRYYLLVRELLELGRETDAAHWLEAGLQRFPGDTSLGSQLVTFGVRSDAAKDYRRSVQYYQRAVAIDARNISAVHGLGNALVMLGQNGPAIHVYEQAVTANPADAQLRFSLGSLYAMQQRLAEATRHWEVLRTLNPELAVRLAQILGT